MGEAGMVVDTSPFSEEVGMGILNCASGDQGKIQADFLR